MIHITVVTLFPDMFREPMATSMMGRAIKGGYLDVDYVNIRDFAPDKYKTVDDKPYGGGHGMIMRVDIVDAALTEAKNRHMKLPLTLLMDPKGERFSQNLAGRLSAESDIILLCGHYEGIDERIRSLVDGEISIGDYILTGGELPAMVIIDAVVRLIPGVLGAEAGPVEESFGMGGNLLEFPQYTRPPEFRGQKVPEILISGNHAAVDAWRKTKAQEITKNRRPDLLRKTKN